MFFVYLQNGSYCQPINNLLKLRINQSVWHVEGETKGIRKKEGGASDDLNFKLLVQAFYLEFLHLILQETLGDAESFGGLGLDKVGLFQRPFQHLLFDIV